MMVSRAVSSDVEKTNKRLLVRDTCTNIFRYCGPEKFIEHLKEGILYSRLSALEGEQE